MAHEEVLLRSDGQFPVAGLVLAIVSIKPGDDDPAVRIGVRSLSTGETQQVILRPAKPQHVLGHVLEVVQVTREPERTARVAVQADEPVA